MSINSSLSKHRALPLRVTPQDIFTPRCFLLKNPKPPTFRPIVSYTHGGVSTVFVEKEYLRKGDRVLIIDDFLAHGEAMRGLIELVGQAGAELVGCAAAIEKGFQGGGDALRAKGIDLYSLAVIDSMNEGKIVFREQD